MPRTLKILIGLIAVWAMGWVWHGPLGQGEAFVASIEAQARHEIAPVEIPGIQIHFGRHPLTRTATMSGQADELQREGLGSEWGLNDYVRDVPGIAGVHWTDQPGGPGGLPLLVETLLQVALAYALGFGIGAIFFARPRRKSFLD
jgi:hypothetical protein